MKPDTNVAGSSSNPRWPTSWSLSRLGSAITFSAEMVVATDLVVFLSRQSGGRAAIETASAWLGLDRRSVLLEDVLQSLERAGMIAPRAAEPSIVRLSEGLADWSLADVAAAVGELTNGVALPPSELRAPCDADGVVAVVQHEVFAALGELSLGALAAAPALS